MDINIDVFDSKSVEKAIKQLNKVKALYPKMVEVLLQRSCERLKEMARANLYNSDIGSDVIAEVDSQWEIVNNGGSAILKNGEGKGYMVEFGVGIVGQYNAHPLARIEGYEYNIDTVHKNQAGAWRFKVGGKDSVDLKENYYTLSEGQRGYTVETKGSPATLFCYNALVDFVRSKEPQRIWDNICKEYIK